MVVMAHVGLILTFPFLQYSTIVGLVVSVVGLIYKKGMPQFNAAYLQQIITEDHFQNLAYVALLAFQGSSFLLLAPLVLFSYITIAELANIDSFPGFVRGLLEKGRKDRHTYYQLKCDLELYVAIYLTVGILLGWSSFIGLFFAWQFLRLKYMINYCTKYSF